MRFKKKNQERNQATMNLKVMWMSLLSPKKYSNELFTIPFLCWMKLIFKCIFFNNILITDPKLWMCKKLKKMKNKMRLLAFWAVKQVNQKKKKKIQKKFQLRYWILKKEEKAWLLHFKSNNYKDYINNQHLNLFQEILIIK